MPRLEPFFKDRRLLHRLEAKGVEPLLGYPYTYPHSGDTL